MSNMQEQQTELVLENRQVVTIFLGLGLLCGVFFALGYVVGNNTASRPTATAQTEESIPQSSEKPSAMPAPSYMPRNPAAVGQLMEETPPDTELNFYSSVQEDEPQGMLPAEDAGLELETDASEESHPVIAVVPPPPGIVVQVLTVVVDDYHH